MAKLVLSMQGQMLSEFAIEKQRMTVGRKTDNDIHIDNIAVSGRHAEVVRLIDQYYIQDLNSTNGTFINGQRITKRVLMDGDVALIGKHELRFSASPGQAPAVPADEAPVDHTRTVPIRAPSFAAKPEPSATVASRSWLERITGWMDTLSRKGN